MSLYKHIRDLVSKYEFISNTKFTGGYFYMYYNKDGIEKYKRLPYRTKSTSTPW